MSTFLAILLYLNTGQYIGNIIYLCTGLFLAILLYLYVYWPIYWNYNLPVYAPVYWPINWHFNANVYGHVICNTIVPVCQPRSWNYNVPSTGLYPPILYWLYTGLYLGILMFYLRAFFLQYYSILVYQPIYWNYNLLSKNMFPPILLYLYTSLYIYWNYNLPIYGPVSSNTIVPVYWHVLVITLFIYCTVYAIIQYLYAGLLIVMLLYINT